MAMTDSLANAGSVTPAKPATSSPAFTAPLFFAGVFFVFLGERVLGHLGSAHLVATGTGAIAMLVATTIRWFKGMQAAGERGRIERLLGIAQVVTCLAVALALVLYQHPSTLGLETLAADRRQFWAGALQVAWLVLLLIGLLPLVFAETALIPMRRAEHPESRRVVAAASAGLTIALALGYLGLFIGSAHHYGVALDYAYFKTAKPSTSTLSVAKSLKEPVRIVAFFPALSEVRSEVERYLREVSRSSPKIKVEFVDRVLEPKLAREMRVSQDGTVVLSRGEVRQMLNVGLEIKKARSVLRNFDAEFQKNLMKLARDTRTAYLTIGHRELNERSTSDNRRDTGTFTTALRKLLEMQNYRIQDLGMVQGLAAEVPADANLVIVLGPRDPFSPQEVNALRRYVARGGALLLALDAEALPSQTPQASTPVPSAAPASSASAAPAAPAAANLGGAGLAPNLDELAGLVGVAIDPTLLANDRGNTVAVAGNKSDVTKIVTNRFSSHASVTTLNRHSAWVVSFGSGSLKKVDPNDKSIDFAIHSTATTFADKNGNFAFDETEKRGSYELGAAITRTRAGAEKPGDQRSFVLADADLFSDEVLLNVPTNRFLLVDIVRWLGGEESLRGEVTSEDDVRIEHTKDKDVFWFYATIFGVPAIVLGVGLYLSRRSKREGN